MTIETLDEVFAQIDFDQLLRGESAADPFLREMQDRADAKVTAFTPITVEERLKSFELIGYRPHGIYLPDDAEARKELQHRLQTVGAINEVDQRLTAYHQIQAECEEWQTSGIAGHWTGQQAIARSPATFRLVGWARRGGKTMAAASEALALAMYRPGSWIWLAAPIMDLVSRSFDMVLKMIRDRGFKYRKINNTVQHKLIVLDNYSRIEGVSLENPPSAAGTAIDLAVVDEAAQITPDAWYRAIMPPLTDHNGKALLLSAWEGDENFFAKKAEDAKQEMLEKGTESNWEVFVSPSYEVNFYQFPQGRQTPALKIAESEMPPHDFLEQFGAIPQGAKGRVFPEFKERVHVGEFPFDPNQPVILAVDPSSGPNPYAVSVIQDYGDYWHVIDEFYRGSVLEEEVTEDLRQREWASNVVEMIVDSASPDKIRRLVELGWPAYPVFEKPKIELRLPMYSAQLRDPLRFHRFYRQKTNEVLDKRGLPADLDLQFGAMNAKELQLLTLEVEESISDINLTPDDVVQLRGCTRVRIDRRCVNIIKEHKSYAYPRRRDERNNFKLVPMDKDNHAMDNLGYFCWTKKRFEATEFADTDFSIIESTSAMEPIPLSWTERKEETDDPQTVQAVEDRTRKFFDTMRERYSLSTPLDYTFLRSA